MSFAPTSPRTGAIGALVATCVAFSGWACPAASATPAEVSIASTEVALSPEEGGGGSAAVSLTNLTNDDIVVTGVPASPRRGCVVTFDNDAKLQPARTTGLKATFSAACGELKASFPFTIAAGAQEFDVVAAQADTEHLDTGPLVWFVYALVASLIVCVAVLAWWLSGQGRDPLLALKSLDQNWSPSDSWLTNATVIGALLSGVFGSEDVVQAILGRELDGEVAAATVGGAISLALIAAAGIVVLACRRWDDGFLTPLGVTLGSVLAFGAAGGQLGVVYETAEGLDLGALNGFWLVALFVLTLLLLALYAITSLLSIFRQEAPTPSVLGVVGLDLEVEARTRRSALP